MSKSRKIVWRAAIIITVIVVLPAVGHLVAYLAGIMADWVEHPNRFPALTFLASCFGYAVLGFVVIVPILVVLFKIADNNPDGRLNTFIERVIN